MKLIAYPLQRFIRANYGCNVMKPYYVEVSVCTISENSFSLIPPST